MQRVTRPSRYTSLPSPPAFPSSPGYFGGGDPASGVPATVPGYEWFNGVQEELTAFLAAASITPAAGDTAQVLRAARRIIGKNIAVFPTVGVFTFTPIVDRVRLRMWGAGGGGGMAIGAWQAGGAGGGAGYGEAYVDVTPGVGIPVTVGAGGAGGITGSTYGQSGGSTSFGSVATITGAQGGAANVNYGGTGGSVFGFSLAIYGQQGANGRAFTNVVSAIGGAAFGSAGGVQGVGDIGRPGMWPGGGGSGGATDSSGLTSAGGAANGGAGSSALIIVEW